VRLLSGNAYRCAPGAARTPKEVAAQTTLGPLPINIPSTIAAACTNAGVWSMDNPTFQLDEFDWWVQIALHPGNSNNSKLLRAEGLATLCEVWWNNELLHTSRSMFVPASAELSPAALRDLFALPNRAESTTSYADEPTLWLCFRSVSEHLRVTANRRDRPAWKSRLVDHQGLRRVRTSLLGRMPGWSPPVPAIGPYRPIHLCDVGDLHDPASLVNLSILSTITSSEIDSSSEASSQDADEVTAAQTGTITVSVQVPAGVIAARVHIHEPVRGNSVDGTVDGSKQAGAFRAFEADCLVSSDGTCVIVSATVQLEDVNLWWPHTHGDPWLYPMSIVLKDSDHNEVQHDLPSIGFRSVTVDRKLHSSSSNDSRNDSSSDSGSDSGSGFSIVVNGVPVYARGACWTPVDLVSLNPTSALLDDTLDTVVASGMNMLRVGGTMTYETDRFHRRCDELGIMVWQDFMFANLDIPLDNEALLADVRAEVTDHVTRVGQHASTVVLCGGSEVDQQAAMMGIPAEQWNSGLARSVIEPLCAQIIPNIPFVVSSPSAPPLQTQALQTQALHTQALQAQALQTQALPFHVDSGVGHYYGVGAYLRGFDDVRRSNLRFAAECLALANVPENSTLDSLFGDNGRAPHQPLWKERVPRDNGAGWDFDDVRDHYLSKLFEVDPMRLRYSDLERWLDLSRITSTEVFDIVASEWRRSESTCNGSLVWFLRDLWAGAGWGLIDALGRPKPALAGLARRWQPIALALSDEGVNGLDAHLVNETATSVTGTLEAVIVRDGVTIVERAHREVTVAPRTTLRIRVDELFEGFRDLTWAYRFGPAIGELVRVRFQTNEPAGNDPLVCDSHHWISGRPTGIDASVGLTVKGEAIPGTESFRLTVATERTAFGVHLDGDELRSSDNWFHLAPGDQRVLTVRRPRLQGKQSSNLPETLIGQPAPTIVVRALNSRSSARVTW
jgi:beta-mannosidase